jgi:hypothetical protein
MDLNTILELKNNANNLTKEGKWNEAENSYKEIINKINELENEKLTSDILNQKKLILSNLSMVLVKQNKIKESKKKDIEIITKLDKNFSKSYARLVLNYLKEDNFACARYHYLIMKKNCKDEMNKFPDLVNEMEKQIEKNDEETNNLKMLANLFQNK